MNDVSQIANEVKDRIRRSWWLIALQGFLLIVIGALFVIRPGASAVAYVNVLAFFAIARGFFNITASVILSVGEEPGCLVLIIGVSQIIVGAFVLANPLLGTILAVEILFFLIAFSILIGGIMDIFTSIADREYIDQPVWLFVSGIVSVLAAVIILSYPLIGMVSMLTVIGIFTVIGGIATLVAGFRIRSL